MHTFVRARGRLALGLDPLEAAEHAKLIASEAVRDGLRDVGEGAGPVDAIGLSDSEPGTPPCHNRQSAADGGTSDPRQAPGGETDQVPAHEARSW